jgi:hypothetical protein
MASYDPNPRRRGAADLRWLTDLTPRHQPPKAGVGGRGAATRSAFPQSFRLMFGGLTGNSLPCGLRYLLAQLTTVLESPRL